MKNVTIIILLFFLTGTLYAQFQIKASVFGGSSSLVINSNFQIFSTTGQTVAGSEQQAGNFTIQAGFWRPARILTPVEELKNIVPNEYKLEQNYPNPFNPTTNITFGIPELSLVTLKIYDLLGKEIIMLVNEEKPTGKYNVSFNPHRLTSGVYFYRISALSKISNKSFVKTGKMILMK